MTSATFAAEGLFPKPTVMAAPATPTKAPDMDLTNLHGGTLKSADIKGKVVIIRFWATWWDICRREMPSVQKAHREYQGKDVVVMTVSLDGGDDAAVKKFLDEHKYAMPSARDRGMSYARALEVRGVPTTVIIDREQNIAARGFGPLALERADVRKLVQGLLAKK